ncbi:hypothetical protein O181_099061 [Austropuccinia psidii MF-1]|uniref:Uncharacterized protein n=1 Tax=Austropuccinia psidii MF-1 TaxID=1389203 RepID=A0A9Q3JC48_9BASI|nr:hypothetical protein [Austropuccinia psidii MF-1]
MIAVISRQGSFLTSPIEAGCDRAHSNGGVSPEKDVTATATSQAGYDHTGDQVKAQKETKASLRGILKEPDANKHPQGPGSHSQIIQSTEMIRTV